jgi:hypothetical protein
MPDECFLTGHYRQLRAAAIAPRVVIFDEKPATHWYLITIPLSLRPSMVWTSRAHSGPLT